MNSHKNGFILLEIMVSLVILGTVLIISIQSVSLYTRMTYTSRSLNQAAILSQQILAVIYLNNSPGGEGSADIAGTAFRWAVNKTELSEFENEYKITVKWFEQGIEKNVDVYTGKYTKKTI